MSEVAFNKMLEQIEMLTYFQRMALLKKLVSSFDEPKKTPPVAKQQYCNDAFGIWKDYDISVDAIRNKAWR